MHRGWAVTATCTEGSPGSSANARHSVTATAENVVPLLLAVMVARRRDVVTGSKPTWLNAVELVPYDMTPVTSRHAEPSQYWSFQASGCATPSPVPWLESRQNFSSAPLNRIGRAQSYWIHWV